MVAADFKMAIIDAVYRAAGLPVRKPAAAFR